MEIGLKLAIIGIILTLIFGVIGIILGFIPITFNDNEYKISDSEFKYNKNLAKLELRCDVVLLNLIRDLNRLNSQDQNSTDSVIENIGFYYKEMAAISHTLHNYITVPSEYEPSYDSFANTLDLTSDLLIDLKEDIRNTKYTPIGYAQRIDKVFKQFDVSKTYRSKLFALHYGTLSEEIELLGGNLYESDEFEKSIYYAELLLPIYEEKADSKKIAETNYHLVLAYRKVGITGKYDLIKDLEREDHKLYFMKNIWLQMYCNLKAYYNAEKALSAYRETPNKIAVANMLCILGSMNIFPMDNPDQAIEYYKEAAELYSGIDTVKRAKILNTIGAIYYQKGRYLKPEEDEKRVELNNIALSYHKQALNLIKDDDSKNSVLLFAINYNMELIETNSRGAPMMDSFY